MRSEKENLDQVPEGESGSSPEKEQAQHASVRQRQLGHHEMTPQQLEFCRSSLGLKVPPIATVPMPQSVMMTPSMRRWFLALLLVMFLELFLQHRSHIRAGCASHEFIQASTVFKVVCAAAIFGYLHADWFSWVLHSFFDNTRTLEHPLLAVRKFSHIFHWHHYAKSVDVNDHVADLNVVPPMVVSLHWVCRLLLAAAANSSVFTATGDDKCSQSEDVAWKLFVPMYVVFITWIGAIALANHAWCHWVRTGHRAYVPVWVRNIAWPCGVLITPGRHFRHHKSGSGNCQGSESATRENFAFVNFRLGMMHERLFSTAVKITTSLLIFLGALVGWSPGRAGCADGKVRFRQDVHYWLNMILLFLLANPGFCILVLNVLPVACGWVVS